MLRLRSACWTILALMWTLGAVRAGDEEAAVQTILAGDLKLHIDVLADDSMEGRKAGSQGGRAAGGYLAEQLQKLGLQGGGDRGGFFQDFQGGYRNVIGILPGSDPQRREEYVLVGAHYDHVGYGTRKTSLGPIGYIHNGADDNASGVAGLLEVIEAMKTLDHHPARSVIFAFWDAEEIGLLGSKHWSSHPTIPMDRVVFAINCDMIGRLGDDGLKVFGSRTSSGLRRFVSMENADQNLPIEFTWELKANSDHHTFFDREIPVLMLHSGLHDDYHRPSDDAHKINHQGAESVARLLFALTHELANAPTIHSFRSRSRDEKLADQQRLEQPLPPHPPRLGVSWQSSDETNAGLLLTHVSPDSPAERAGLRVGDRLIRFAGRIIGNDDRLRQEVLAAPSPAQVVVERAPDETVELTVELAGAPLRLGISWREDEAEPGVLVLTRVVADSPAEAAGLKLGDRIYRLGGKKFADGVDFQRMVAEAEQEIRLLVERQGQLRTVTVPISSQDFPASGT